MNPPKILDDAQWRRIQGLERTLTSLRRLLVAALLLCATFIFAWRMAVDTANGRLEVVKIISLAFQQECK